MARKTPQAKPEANPQVVASSTRKTVQRYKSKMRPNYCRYCTAKLPRGPRRFCNAKHHAAFTGD